MAGGQQSELIQEAEKFVMRQFKEKRRPFLHYHNFEHTKDVVAASNEIALDEKLNKEEWLLINVAALFHDLGYLDGMENHEERSATIASSFLQEHDMPERFIAEVKGLIYATKLDFKPENLLQKVIKDADTAHLGKDGFEKKSNALKKEVQIFSGSDITEKQWLKGNLQFFKNHSYYTKSAKALYNDKKAATMKDIEKSLAESKGTKKANKNRGEKKGRGIETMFRVTLRNHTSLSQIADNKANIMLSINAIIVSIVLTTLIPKLDNNLFLIWPSILLLSVCIASIILATISTIPKVSKNTNSQSLKSSHSKNLLFFGNFHDMKMDDYVSGMQEMMKDEEFVYESLIKDLYYLGAVLHKKYKYLRYCYGVFMVGIILSVIAYLFALLSTQPSSFSI